MEVTSLEPFPGTLVERLAAVRPDGSFVVENLPQGKYRVRPTFAVGGAYLAGLRMGETATVLAANSTIDLTTGLPPNLEVLFRPGAVLLEVIVDRGADQDPGTVIVVPVFSGAIVAGEAIVLTPDAAGFTEARNLAPGTYRAYAFEHFEPAAGIDPDLLRRVEAKSSALTLTSGQAGRVAVTRITAVDSSVN